MKLSVFVFKLQGIELKIESKLYEKLMQSFSLQMSVFMMQDAGIICSASGHLVCT